jgi:hypothetical protein
MIKYRLCMLKDCLTPRFNLVKQKKKFPHCKAHNAGSFKNQPALFFFFEYYS